MSPRGRFIVRRLLLAIPVIVVMSVFVFLMIHLVPGDPVQTMLGFRATPQNVATVREQLGLDRPLLAQYLTWAGNLLHGDFGQDFISHAPVSFLKDPVAYLSYLILPVLAFAFSEAAYILRTTRGAMEEVLGTQYMLFLR